MGIRSRGKDLIVSVVVAVSAAPLSTGFAFANQAPAGAGSTSSAPASGVIAPENAPIPLGPGDLAGIAGALIGGVGLVLAYLQWRHPKPIGPPSSEVKNVSADEARVLLQGAADAAKPDGSPQDVEQQVIEIASRHVYVSPTGTGSNVGLMSSMVATVFLDLFSAATDRSSRSVLAEALAKSVRSACALRHTAFDALAVPKEGNVLLADEAARLLGLPLLVVRTARAIRFGDPIEGIRPAGRRVALVDDISSDGGMLKACVESLRAAGFNLSDCCCVFERTDGDARDMLGAISVTLRAVNQIDEKVLRELAKL